ncbi:MAG: hypothetical protein P4L35_19545 [Ignavibacteriaceae bacterium]|nr:hypothetical protein [Ignavibacteriaceae bacterium]
MLKLETWSTEQPIHIRIFAIFLSIAANTCFEVLSDVKNNKLREPFKIPDISIWFKFYHSHRYLQQYLITSFSKFDGIPSIFAYGLKQLTQKDQLQTIDKNNTQSQEISLEDIYNILISYVKNEIEGTPLNDKERENVLENIVTPEFLFLMKVDFPCQFLYHESPVRIFRKARLGDLKSLDKLLRLDKTIIRHSRISKWFTHYNSKEDKREIEKLSEAIPKPFPHKISLTKEKYRIAGFISYFTELLGNRLSSPEIRSLFNAVAADYGIDSLIDPDLPDSPEAFEKAVRRQRSVWKTALANNRTKLS